MKIPTITKMLKVYVDSATVERLKCGRPGEGTVQNTISGVKAFRRWINQRREALGREIFAFPVPRCADGETEVERFADDESPLVSIIKPPLIHKYLSDMLKRGVKPVTAMSYLNQLQQLFARWVRPYYDDRGWKIPQFPSLGGRPKATRYQRPSSEQLSKVKHWYEQLTGDMEKEIAADRDSLAVSQRTALWFVATMMLEFAMRNSDVLRLKAENFVEKDGITYLNYTPHKTENSSGRVVKWPIHPSLWEQLKAVLFARQNPSCSPFRISLDYNEDVFRELNRQMRGLGFAGSKGAYELRKICVDHVYQKYGAEMATSISGDDIKTIIRYYADPSQPNIGAVRVIDLL